MKAILCLMMLAASALAEELKVDIVLANGRTLAGVEVVELGAKGIKVKSSRGTQTLAFSDITQEAAEKLGAFNPDNGPAPGSVQVQRFIETPLAKQAGESTKEHKQRIDTVIQQAQRAAKDRWLSVERDQMPVENRAQAFALEMFVVRAQAALKNSKK